MGGGRHNGYEYVDLGLPSGLLWATCNVGAEKPEDYGLYFNWGSIEGFNGEDIVSGRGNNKSYSPNTVLPLENDAAHVFMGSDWRMPTKSEMEELINNCNYSWTEYNGVIGALYTSKANPDKTIFFPAAGSGISERKVVSGEKSSVYVWSSTNGDGSSAWDLWVKDSRNAMSSGNRGYGFSIRGIISPL